MPLIFYELVGTRSVVVTLAECVINMDVTVVVMQDASEAFISLRCKTFLAVNKIILKNIICYNI